MRSVFLFSCAAGALLWAGAAAATVPASGRLYFSVVGGFSVLGRHLFVFRQTTVGVVV
jgi:hypothetical protein